MKQFTKHQEAVMSVITKLDKVPVMAAEITEALPQYSPQCAAMIVGSLYTKGELAVCTTPTLTAQLAQLQKDREELAELRAKLESVVNSTNLSEQSVFQFLLEDADRAHALFTQVNQVMNVQEAEPVESKEERRLSVDEEQELFNKRHVKLKKQYRTALSKAIEETLEPVILPEFNEAYFQSLSVSDKEFLRSPQEVNEFIGEGKLLKGLHQSNLTKVFTQYYLAIQAGDPLEYFIKETNTVDYGAVRFYGDRPIWIENSKGSYSSFDGEGIEKALYILANQYLDRLEAQSLSHQTCLELLGLHEKQACNGSEIKKAYRKLAMKHHPDRGGDVELMAKINEAYQILLNQL